MQARKDVRSNSNENTMDEEEFRRIVRDGKTKKNFENKIRD